MAVKITPQHLVLAVADSQVGYSRWSDEKQGTKYARETQPVFWPKDFWLLANGISYCDLFVTWVFWKALGEDFVTDGGLPAGASYNTDYRASKGGRVSKPPKPGDVLVFDWNWETRSTNHVGILEKVLPSGNYQTIEGNTSIGSSGSQSNGGRVARRVRRPDQVRYVIRPNWSKAVKISTPGNTGSDTITLFADVDKTQSWLTKLGYTPGKIDGVFGDKTAAATKQYQIDFGITPADGRPGPATRTELEATVAKIDDIIKKLDDLPREVMHIKVPLEGKGWKGQSSDLAGIRKWYAADMAAIKSLIRGLIALVEKQFAANKALLDAVQKANTSGTPIDLSAVQAAASKGAEEGVSKAIKSVEADVTLSVQSED